MLDMLLDSWFSDWLRKTNQKRLFCVKNMFKNKYKYKIHTLYNMCKYCNLKTIMVTG